ncbi:chemokine-like protein TAFA-3 [Clavelina lepadiformis]|uniref:Uncharacterized protein n=1 Tax=Clavelina lepadiformis TaxID=159417 RepID=A0ABP0FY11_CLALP
MFIVMLFLLSHLGEVSAFATQEPLVESCEILSDKSKHFIGKESLERTIKCACRSGKIAGTSRESPACVPEYIFWAELWCDMQPCLTNETCTVHYDMSGWSCSDGVKVKNINIKATPESLRR